MFYFWGCYRIDSSWQGSSWVSTQLLDGANPQRSQDGLLKCPSHLTPEQFSCQYEWKQHQAKAMSCKIKKYELAAYKNQGTENSVDAEP